MYLLALETANEQCSVAIIHQANVIAYRCDERSKMQTQVILPMIKQLLHETQLTFDQLSAIAFSRGPGAFSGVRINATVAQALAWSHHLPVISISTLQALAYRAYRQYGLTEVTPVLDARMQEVYLANVRCTEQHVEILGDEMLLNYAQANETCLFTPIGSGTAFITEKTAHPEALQLHATAQEIGLLAYHTPSSDWLTAEQALPVYLRNDAWKKIADQGK